MNRSIQLSMDKAHANHDHDHHHHHSRDTDIKSMEDQVHNDLHSLVNPLRDKQGPKNDDWD